MLNDDLPNCVCGNAKENLVPQTRNVKPTFMEETWACKECGRFLLYVSAEGLDLVVSPEEGEPTEAQRSWLNRTVYPSWREVTKGREEAFDHESQLWCIEYCKKHGLAPKTRVEEIEKDHQEVHEAFREFYEGFQKSWRAERPEPLPPNIPEGLHVFGRTVEGWKEIDREKTIGLDEPPPPGRHDHDEFFVPLFHTLRERTGKHFEYEECENHYNHDPDRPFYNFQILDKIFNIGPRDRTVVIRAFGSKSPFDTTYIEELAKKDAAELELPNNSNFNWLQIETLSKEKAIQYIMCIIRAQPLVGEAA
jgi:hypothetical protein